MLNVVHLNVLLFDFNIKINFISTNLLVIIQFCKTKSKGFPMSNFLLQDSHIITSLGFFSFFNSSKNFSIHGFD
jgi:hypothetical protein